MTLKTKKYNNCRLHDTCRKVSGYGGVWELVKCPWCGYEVSTSNIGKWCARCYCMFKVINGFIHFGKKFSKTPAEALAIAINKLGGARFGKTEKDK